ncbi:MAG: Chemotaxis protein CheY [Firmicutes bacterium ADurb.Bin419]|nr:MAG: Chemotaxis protein CheY [Firmicutes bacterium ADurb.Bin419]
MARILVVDDSEVMRKNLKHILIEGGHTVVGEASNGNEAVALNDELKPDLITMDLSMPGLDGITLVKIIMNKYPESKIIVITALSQKSLIYEAIKNGAKHYIMKPIDKLKVLGTINDTLNAQN